MKKMDDYTLLLYCSVVVSVLFSVYWFFVGVDPGTELLDNIIMVGYAGGLMCLPVFVGRFVWKSKSPQK